MINIDKAIPLNQRWFVGDLAARNMNQEINEMNQERNGKQQADDSNNEQLTIGQESPKERWKRSKKLSFTIIESLSY